MPDAKGWHKVEEGLPPLEKFVIIVRTPNKMRICNYGIARFRQLPTRMEWMSQINNMTMRDVIAWKYIEGPVDFIEE